MAMQKQVFFLLSTLFWVAFSFKSTAKPIPVEDKKILASPCNAPAPNNFRVTGLAPGELTIGWDETWPGATYTLLVYSRELNQTSSPWLLVDSLNEYPYTDYIMAYSNSDTEYKCILSTNCSGGEISIQKTELPPKVILDLITGGLLPLTPTEFDDCSWISSSDYDWIGIRVHKIGTPLAHATYFEIRQESFIRVHFSRIGGQNLYAVDEELEWPMPTKYPENPVPIIYSLGENQIIIGEVEIHMDEDFHNFKLCKQNNLWNANFEYKYIATNSLGIPSEGVTFRDPQKDYDTLKTSVNNPFTDYIVVKNLNFDINEPKSLNYSLFDSKGVALLTKHEVVFDKNLIIDTRRVERGAYFLQITLDRKTQFFKILKL